MAGAVSAIKTDVSGGLIGTAVDETHLADIGNKRQRRINERPEAAGPVDKNGLSDQIVARNDTTPINSVVVSKTVIKPEATIKAGGAVISENKKLILTQSKGISFPGKGRFPV